MIKAFKNFWTSYYTKVLIPFIKWMKKHSKGMIIYTLICGIIPTCYTFRGSICDKIEELFMQIKSRKEEESH